MNVVDSVTGAWKSGSEASRTQLTLQLVEVVATVCLLVVANRIAQRSLWLNDRPILALRRRHGKFEISNEGLGMALNVYVVNRHAAKLKELGFIASRDCVVVEGFSFVSDAAQTNVIYCRSMSGYWWRTKATAPIFKGEDENVSYINRFDQISIWQVPVAILDAVRKEARTLVESFDSYGSLLTLDGLKFKAVTGVRNVGRVIDRWFVRRSQREALTAFEGLPIDSPPRGVDQTTRADWPFDVDGYLQCYHTSGAEFHQHSCSTVDGNVVAQIEFSIVGKARVQGHLVVPESILPMAGDRKERSNLLRATLNDFLCALYPEGRFVLEVRAWPPRRRFIPRLLHRRPDI